VTEGTLEIAHGLLSAALRIEMETYSHPLPGASHNGVDTAMLLHRDRALSSVARGLRLTPSCGDA